MRRAVYVTLEDPWASDHGGTLRTRAIATAASKLLDVTIVCPGPTANVHLISDNLRVSTFKGAMVGQRQWRFVRKVKRAALPIPLGLGATSLERNKILGSFSPVDVVIASELYMLTSARNLSASMTWMDQSDLLSEFALSVGRARRFPMSRTAALQGYYIRRQEQAAGTKATVLTAAGYHDAAKLASMTGRKVFWLPTPLPAPENLTAPPNRNVLGFLANFKFEPNKKAYAELVSVWLPRLRGRFSVLVAGHGSDALPAVPGIEILGPLESPSEFYSEVDATIVPISTGGGMKVKIIESMLHCRPSYASTHARIGLPPDIDSLTRDINQLRREEVVEPLARSSVATVTEAYSIKKFDKLVTSSIAQCLA